MKKQSGFTLIEMVVVMVILGILAAVALPKFVNMSSDARLAKMNGAVGAVRSAQALAHAKWLASGSPTTGIDIEGTTAVMVNGYPKASDIKVLAGLEGYDVDSSTTAGTATIADASGSSCKFTYTEAVSGNVPSFVLSGLVAANCK